MMPRPYPIRATSALIRFFLPPNLHGTGIHIYVKGTPDNVKLALRKACSHRRTMVVARPGYYFCNVVGQLHKLIPQDCSAIWMDKVNDSAPLEHISWHYEIAVVNDAPMIKWGQYGHTPTVEPLFHFFGYEWRRPKTPRKPREGKARGGRPSSFRKRHPELFTPGKTAVAQNGDALGLKDKRRKIHVDFTGTIMPNKEYGETLLSLDQALYDAQFEDGAVDEDRPLSDEQARELDELYGTAGGAQP